MNFDDITIEEVRAIPCPKADFLCGADAGEMCWPKSSHYRTLDPNKRDSYHWERWEAAFAARSLV